MAALASLAVLAGLMLVDGHYVLLIALLVVYSLGAGAGTALALSQPSARAVEEELESQRRDLITAVSHDLRTPLEPSGDDRGRSMSESSTTPGDDARLRPRDASLGGPRSPPSSTTSSS